MPDRTSPIEFWRGDEGEAWTERCLDSASELDRKRRERDGISRTELNEEFVGDLDRDARILEVGANTGAQLDCLKQMGFERLYAVDIQRYALERGQELLPDVEAIQADGLSLPFADDTFDVVFTTGTLIHVPPEFIDDAITELTRCSRQYVWGREYFAEEYTPIRYHGRDDVLYKTDFASLFEEHGLELVQERLIPYGDSDNRDVMYLFDVTG